MENGKNWFCNRWEELSERKFNNRGNLIIGKTGNVWAIKKKSISGAKLLGLLFGK